LKCISVALQHRQICFKDVVQFLAEIPAVQGGRCCILRIQGLDVTVEKLEQGTQQISAMFQQLISNISISANCLENRILHRINKRKMKLFDSIYQNKTTEFLQHKFSILQRQDAGIKEAILEEIRRAHKLTTQSHLLGVGHPAWMEVEHRRYGIIRLVCETLCVVDKHNHRLPVNLIKFKGYCY